MDNRINIFDQDLVTYYNPLSLISESFKMVRTNIEFSAIGREIKALSITSSSQTEGKSTTLANLAVSYAQIGRKVLLVDADLRRPSIHRLFSLSNRRGLTNILLTGAELDDYVQPMPIENLSVITSGPIPPNPAELLMSKAMDQFMVNVRQAYELVMIDCPPVGAVTDAAIIATKVDGTIFVVRAGVVDRNQLKRATELLKQVKAPVLGFVLNGISPSTDDHYYYYYQDEYSENAARKRKKSGKAPNRRQPPPNQRRQPVNTREAAAQPPTSVNRPAPAPVIRSSPVPLQLGNQDFPRTGNLQTEKDQSKDSESRT